MHAAFTYVVRIAFLDREPMGGFLAWLRDHHVADVLAAGALDAELVRLDDEAHHVIEARYRFASREAFAHYEREHAPRLRRGGLAELGRLGLPPDRVTFLRTTGEIVARS